MRSAHCQKRLPEREIKTVQEMNWAGVKNGELLKLVEAEFDVFITSDKNFRHQQNLENRKLAILLLPSSRVPVIESLLPQVDDELEKIKSGDFLELESIKISRQLKVNED